MIDDVIRLIDDLQRTLPTLRIKFDPMPSGAFYLDVFPGGDNWITMRYFPSQELFGVDETTEADSFSEYYKFVTADFDAAAAELRRLIHSKSAMNGQAVTPSPVAAASSE